MSQLVWRTLEEEAMDSQKSYFVGQLRSLVAPTPSSAAFPSAEETASHPHWLRTFYNSSQQELDRRAGSAGNPAPDSVAIRFVLCAERFSQGRFLVKDDEEVSHKQKRGGVNRERK